MSAAKAFFCNRGIEMSNFKKDILHENEDKSDVRLNRFLSDAGFCSRREADRLIEAGRVTVMARRLSLVPG